MRLIDADALHEEMCERMTRFHALGQAHVAQDYNFVATVVGNAPTVDAVPVVRCRDGKYSVNAKWNKKGYRICPASHMEITDGDFCSYGEHRDQSADVRKMEADDAAESHD